MQSFLYNPVSDIRDVGPAYDDAIDDDANPEDPIPSLPSPNPPPNTDDPPQEPRAEEGFADIDDDDDDPQLNTAATPEPAIC